MGMIESGKQWKIVLVGDVNPQWGSDPVAIGVMLQSALSMNLALMQAFRWSNISFSQVGEQFPLPGQPSNPN